MGSDRESRRRLMECFQAASALEGDERAAYVKRISTEAPELCERLERLLAAQRSHEVQDFLEPPRFTLSAIVETQPDQNRGRRIGPYELIEPLGSGGMGSVYLAARQDDYRQLVAIKLIKRGMDTEEVIKRFRDERQTLAVLNHPNIARLLDGGTDDDLPYFVMEYVEGRPIDEHCDLNRLAIADRLELFLRVCDAVAHAHGHTMVHRDLKPANVLVTEDAEPKLLDFGLARLLNPAISFTRVGATRKEERYLTVSYASPEQLQGDTVGKPSDVYSLGVLLYRLLTGCAPHRLRGRSRREIERIVCFDTPPLPSTVVRHLREDADPDETSPWAAARERSTNPAELSRLLKGDLDNIAMMALRKEPRERYADAGELAADIRRWTRDEPITARKDTLWYVAGKFVRRYRLLVASTAAVLIVLVAGLVVSLSALAYAFQQEERADQAESAYERAHRASISKKLAGTVLTGLVDDDELNLLLAIEAVEQSPTPVAELALRRLLARIKPGCRLEGHTGVIEAAAFSPTGDRVVSVSHDGTARVWEARTGEPICTMRGHDSPVHTAVFSPDGKRIATTGDDGAARIWDALTGAPMMQLTSTEPLLDATFTPDGRWIVTSGADGAIRTWDDETGAEQATVTVAPGPIPRALLSPDGRLLACAASDRTGRIIEVASGTELAVMEGHRGSVRGASFDATSRRIVTASDDQTCRVWDVMTGREQLVLRGHHDPVLDAAFSPDGEWIVSAGADDTVRVWDAATGACLLVEGGHAAAFSPDGAWLVVAHHDHSAQVYPWEMFAPLADNLREAKSRVTRKLTAAERAEHVRELTEEERAELLSRPDLGRNLP